MLFFELLQRFDSVHPHFFVSVGLLWTVQKMLKTSCAAQTRVLQGVESSSEDERVAVSTAKSTK